MLNFKHSFSSFSVDNLDRANQFYSAVTGLRTERSSMGLRLFLNNEATVFVYEKKEHRPASFTILNFVVSNLDETVSQLKSKGVELEHYDGLTDGTGIHRGLASNNGPDIAWFKDPAGNILSVLQET